MSLQALGAATPTIPSEGREGEAKARSKDGEIISVGRRNTYNTIRREREREEQGAKVGSKA